MCGNRRECPERPQADHELPERKRLFQVTVCSGGPLPVGNNPSGPNQNDHHHLPKVGKTEHASQDGMAGHARQLFIQEREDGGRTTLRSILRAPASKKFHGLATASHDVNPVDRQVSSQDAHRRLGTRPFKIAEQDFGYPAGKHSPRPMACAKRQRRSISLPIKRIFPAIFLTFTAIMVRIHPGTREGCSRASEWFFSGATLFIRHHG
jgi:hypothetical protein